MERRRLLSFVALVGGITLGIFVVLLISAALSLAVLRSEFGLKLLRYPLKELDRVSKCSPWHSRQGSV